MENLCFMKLSDRGLLHGGGEGEQAGAAARRDGQGAQQQGAAGGAGCPGCDGGDLW